MHGARADAPGCFRSFPRGHDSLRHIPLLSCSVMCELGVSKPRFCFAAGSLLGSANRGSQREPARLEEGTASLLLEVYAFQPPSGLPAPHQRRHRSRSSRLIQSAVCPHLQNQPHCTPHAGDTGPTYQEPPQKSDFQTHWPLLQAGR